MHTAPAREIAARQIGNIQCNIDRLAIVGGLAGLQKTLGGIDAGEYVPSPPPLPLSFPLVPSSPANALPLSPPLATRRPPQACSPSRTP